MKCELVEEMIYFCGVFFVVNFPPLWVSNCGMIWRVNALNMNGRQRLLNYWLLKIPTVSAVRVDGWSRYLILWELYALDHDNTDVYLPFTEFDTIVYQGHRQHILVAQHIYLHAGLQLNFISLARKIGWVTFFNDALLQETGELSKTIDYFFLALGETDGWSTG